MGILGVSLRHGNSLTLVLDGWVANIVEAERYFWQKRCKLHCTHLLPGRYCSGYQYDSARGHWINSIAIDEIQDLQQFVAETYPISAVGIFDHILGIPSVDNTFSLEPNEFRAMGEAIRHVEKASREVRYEVGAEESKGRVFRRSLFVVKDVKAGEILTEENVRSIRSGHGPHWRHKKDIASQGIVGNTPLSWTHVASG